MWSVSESMRRTFGGTYPSEREVGLYRWVRDEWRLRRLVSLQIRSGQPPEVRATFERLHAAGLAPARARRLIRGVLAREVRAMLRDRRVFDAEDFAHRLAVIEFASTRLVQREAAPMRQVLFVQGGGEGVHDQWDNQLVESLRGELGPAYEIRYPVMPNEADPQYAAWKVALQSELAALQDGAVVVGHSVGGTILINVLAERTPGCHLGAICLIAAPFVGTGGWKSDDIEPRSDLAAQLPRDVPIFLYHGRDDDTVPFAHVELYARAIPRAHVRHLAGRDHQLDNRLSEVATDIRRLTQSSDTDSTRGSADAEPPRRSNDREV